MARAGTTKGIVLFVTAAALAASALARQSSRPVRKPATLVPVASREDRAAAAGWGKGTWMDQHLAINRIGKEHPDLQVVFLGDSITQGWGGPGRRVGTSAGNLWRKFFGGMHAANFGISGDRTQHVLWRIDHGNFDHIDPRVIVLLIGTNNLPHDSAADIAAGIRAILDRLATKAPRATILLCTIERGKTADDPVREKVEAVNRAIRQMADGKRVRLVDLARRFIRADGTADPKLMRGDCIHFKKAGYRVWAEMVRPMIDGILRENPF